MERRGKIDPHAYHIFGTQALSYVAKIEDSALRKETIEQARALVAEGRRNHPRSPELKDVEEKLTTAYLSLALE